MPRTSRQLGHGVTLRHATRLAAPSRPEGAVEDRSLPLVLARRRGNTSAQTRSTVDTGFALVRGPSAESRGEPKPTNLSTRRWLRCLCLQATRSCPPRPRRIRGSKRCIDLFPRSLTIRTLARFGVNYQQSYAGVAADRTGVDLSLMLNSRA